MFWDPFSLLPAFKTLPGQMPLLGSWMTVAKRTKVHLARDQGQHWLYQQQLHTTRDCLEMFSKKEQEGLINPVKLPLVEGLPLSLYVFGV